MKLFNVNDRELTSRASAFSRVDNVQLEVYYIYRDFEIYVSLDYDPVLVSID